ncbi:hypothetical protein H7E67_01915 [Clostridium gasigenes]|uniref:hypothetical protein n=1 Tax=Clostridium gasigenes TaxID=94869 RepID=UPI001624328B|nr:hypothetical protein [Clostridium gasigenes]MBB6622176.1 hypothetical protein [Clostridium gasigenes]
MIIDLNSTDRYTIEILLRKSLAEKKKLLIHFEGREKTEENLMIITEFKQEIKDIQELLTKL